MDTKVYRYPKPYISLVDGMVFSTTHCGPHIVHTRSCYGRWGWNISAWEVQSDNRKYNMGYARGTLQQNKINIIVTKCLRLQ